MKTAAASFFFENDVPLKLCLVYTALPPAPNAIGEHTAFLAEALAKQATVQVLTGQDTWAPISGVSVQQAFTVGELKNWSGVLNAIQTGQPDWVVWQYNPFSYHPRGFPNPSLVQVLRRIKQESPNTRIALLAHEVNAPLLNLKMRVMAGWQVVQFLAIARQTDLVFCAIDRWVKRFAKWLPQVPLVSLPVGSNIPFQDVPRTAARQAIGFTEAEWVVGIFGTAHPTRLLGHIKAACEALQTAGVPLQVLYVGPDGKKVTAALAGLPVLDAGRVATEAVPRYFAAMDLYLSPFKSGASMRRGSFLAALQHGVPTISTGGNHTDDLLLHDNNKAFILTPENNVEAFAQAAVSLSRDEGQREAFRSAGAQFYIDHCEWSKLADKLLATLHATSAQ